MMKKKVMKQMRMMINFVFFTLRITFYQYFRSNDISKRVVVEVV